MVSWLVLLPYCPEDSSSNHGAGKNESTEIVIFYYLEHTSITHWRSVSSKASKLPVAVRRSLHDYRSGQSTSGSYLSAAQSGTVIASRESSHPKKLYFGSKCICSIGNAIMSPQKMTADLARHNRVKSRPSYVIWVERIWESGHISIIFGQHKTDVKLFLESYQQFYFSFRKMSEFTRRSGGSIIYGVFSFCVRFLPRIYQRSDQSTNSGATVGTGHRLSIYRQIYLYLQNW